MNSSMPKQPRRAKSFSLPFAVATVSGLLLLGVALTFALSTRTQQPTQTRAAAPPQIGLQLVAEGLSFPGDVTHAGDGTGRLFVTELGGTIRIWDAEQLLELPFLDLRDKVAHGWEQGLLNVTFHPQYAENGRFFVYYVSSEDERGVISEFQVSEDPNRAQSQERVLLEIPSERKAHYGGQMQFGPDGYLYIALGDGLIFGGARREAQDLATLPGSILRIDVDSGDPYGIPADNPFVGRAGARPEIYAYGFRNPWRFSFDQKTGRLFVADVGHERFEEVNLVERGRNYGWPFFEGESCLMEGFRAELGCKLVALRHRFAKPIAVYNHLGIDALGGNSVTGGYVYYGQTLPDLQGSYLFADYVSGRVWALTEERGHWTKTELLKTYHLISSLGEDEQGELYLLDWSTGDMYRMVAGAGRAASVSLPSQR